MSATRLSSKSTIKSNCIFVNCPFDDEFLPLFRPLVFTIIGLGMRPRFALERSDSGEARIGKIIEIISECKFGIHDLSRCKATKRREYYRMNMPLELGMDLGAREFGGQKFAKKKILILEKERYRFQKSISDLSNSDIEAHSGDPLQVVRIVRNWLVQEAGVPPISPTHIWYRFNDFMAETYDKLKHARYSDEDIKKLPEHELTMLMEDWLKRYPL